MTPTILKMDGGSGTAVFPSEHARFRDYVELTKPRLSFLSVATAGVGYFACRVPWEPAVFSAMMLGTSLSAAGVAALNQWMESDTDGLMKRTADRPIPSGRVSTGSAFVMGWLACAAGLAVLFAGVNGLSAAIDLATIVAYLAIYTPAKRWSRWSTEIGAVAGALPPLIGWAATTEHQTLVALVLFGVLFFWQIPHFMAIAWRYRTDYATVHFPMLAVRDESGKWVATWSVIATLAALGCAVAPCLQGYCGAGYLGVTLGLGGWFVLRAARFLLARDRELAARRLFLASITWLPVQLVAFLVWRWL